MLAKIGIRKARARGTAQKYRLHLDGGSPYYIVHTVHTKAKAEGQMF